RQKTITSPLDVIVTSGGFAPNGAMRARYPPQPINDHWTLSNPGETGEALELMLALGADQAVMEEAWWSLSLIPPGSSPRMITSDLQKPHSILVDQSGQRFVNEAESYMELGRE